MIYNYYNKKILIIGMGLTGISALKFFLSKGIYPKIMDTCSNPKYIKKILKFNNIYYHIGSINYSWILESNLIIISPGITSSHPIYKYAHMHNIEIIGDIELFVRETNVPIIAITGSNGKSSVTMMVKEIIQNAGFKTYVGGNIGIPALSILNKKSDFFILELSSFQLENTFNLKAEIATILNISPNHIDRYPLGITQYIRAKKKIYNNAKTCTINLDDQHSHKKIRNNKNCVSFGIKRGLYHLKSIKKNTWLYYKSIKLLNTNELKIFGTHNYINALSALAIVHKLKINFDISTQSLKNFSGLPHRFQKVYYNNNIEWINDSKSTNIESTKLAIRNIATQKKIRLILGGDDKCADFSLLKSSLKDKRIIIYCYGKSKQQLYKLYPNKSTCIDTLSDAVKIISKQVTPGDVVLLSPACSSLDQFSNFEERGETFIKLIKEFTS